MILFEHLLTGESFIFAKIEESFMLSLVTNLPYPFSNFSSVLVFLACFQMSLDLSPDRKMPPR